MKTKFEVQKEKYKIAVMAILVIAACFLMYYFHKILGIETVFTHFFYIPIILAAFWWKRKGIFVAVFLSGLLVLSHIFLREVVMTADDYFRAIMFIIISVVVAMLSEKIARTMEELEKTQKAFIQSEKMASMGKLSAGIAHELNNPLAGVLIYIRLILKKLASNKISPETFTRYLTSMEKEIERCSRIIRNLLDFSRQTRPSLSRVDLNQVLQKVLMLIQHQAELENIEIIKELH
ncbi:MAG: hypothetical protein J7M18_06295, partial [Candidatus Eremiobacteraeota bacterium]|nr:hypothetical protein [Candidatus Eremiobacteraeota bacterium]